MVWDFCGIVGLPFVFGPNTVRARGSAQHYLVLPTHHRTPPIHCHSPCCTSQFSNFGSVGRAQSGVRRPSLVLTSCCCRARSLVWGCARLCLFVVCLGSKGRGWLPFSCYWARCAVGYLGSSLGFRGNCRIGLFGPLLAQALFRQSVFDISQQVGSDSVRQSCLKTSHYRQA